MQVDLPFFTDELPAHYTRRRVQLRALPPTVIEALRRVRDGCVAETATLADGRVVTTDADALTYILEAVHAAAEE